MPSTTRRRFLGTIGLGAAACAVRPAWLAAAPAPAKKPNFLLGFTDAVNQIEYVYDGWGNLVAEKQEHDGAVDQYTLSVQYAYDWDDDPQTDEAAPYLRLSMVTYPDGREVYYNYAGGIAGDISRVSEIADDDLNEGGRTRYAVYGYLGAGAIVTVEHPAVSGGLTLDYGSDGSGGWDDFGRVTGQTWTNSAETTTFDAFAYTYDRASNRVTRDLSLTTGLDEKYTYDGLNRLANTERGTLSGGSITNLAFEQDWSLDELGNWAEFNQDDDGTGGWDLEQDRVHNEANEITDLSGSWVDPAHDLAGNTTLAARPADETSPEEGLVLVYDAWNRPVKVYVDADEGRDPDAGELLATYEYDGQKRRIVETIEGEPDVTRDSYYSDAWQVIEVHEGGDADNPLKQFVWDPRYVDSPIVRFHDGNTDGDYLDAEDDVLYYTTDANFNVTAVVDTSGAVVERYAYDPYGQGTILNGADGADPDVDGETVFEWDPDADGASDVDNRTLYAGYHLDTETGLYSVRNRMYHPTLGRWITRDPGGYADGVNFYEYVGGFPTRALDPSGLKGRVNVGELTTEAVVEEKQCKQAGPDPGVIQRLIDWIRGDEFCCEYSGYTKYETRQSSALEGYWIVRGREPGRGKWIYEQTEVKRFWQYSDLVIFPFGWPVTEYSEYGVYERSYARAYYLVCEYECCNTRTNELETRTKETSTFYERAGTETVTEATGRTKPDIRHTRRQSIEGNRVVGPGDPHPLDEGAPGPAVWPPLPPPGGPPPIVGP